MKRVNQTITKQELQNLINEVENETIYFEKGEYILSTVYLHSNITLEFEKGVKILSSTNFSDYDKDEKVDYTLYQDASHSYFNCSLFVAKNFENITFKGNAIIDMQSVWDEENERKMFNRGAKCIALKECKNIVIKDIEVYNVTDLAIYFAGCENVEISNIKMRTYIDGISPDNSKNVYIHDCDIETGDDGIVFKSSYTLNRLDICKNIKVENCRIKSRCNAIKFGTETNGGFYDFNIKDLYIYETRITGIAIESVDGAIIENLKFSNIKMQNVGTPFFVFIGKRLRGPKGLKVGSIRNITFENITAEGPYEPYNVIEWRYDSFKNKDTYQEPWLLNLVDYKDEDRTLTKNDCWQITSNVCGLEESPLENITFKNVKLKLDGGCKEKDIKVSANIIDYPEVYIYGRVLPAKGIYYRYVNGLTLENVSVETYREDNRDDFVFYNVKFIK